MSEGYYIGKTSGYLEVIDFVPCNSSVGKGSVVCICHKCKIFIKMAVCEFNRKKTCGCSGLGSRKKSVKKEYKKEYSIWANMKRRCLDKKNKSYESYGGRGITICERWLNFANFLDDMGRCPIGCSIDRIDNNKGYCKENCKWSTPIEQAANRRSSVLFEWKGEMLNIYEIARRCGMKTQTVFMRVYEYGMTIEQATSIPVRKHTRKKMA